MMAEQKGLVVQDERVKPVGDSWRSRISEFQVRDRPEDHTALRQDVVGDSLARNSHGNGDQRMGVDHRIAIGPPCERPDVDSDLRTGRSPVQCPALMIDDE